MATWRSWTRAPIWLFVTGRHMRYKKLLLLSEPAPYVLDFLAAVRYEDRHDIEVVFTHHRPTQPWVSGPDLQLKYRFLPPGTLSACRYLWRKLSENEIALVHITGWAGTPIVAAWVIAWYKRVPIFVESDTTLDTPRALWIRFIKRLTYPILFRLPYRFLPAGSKQAKYVRHYGVDTARISIHQMSVDVQSTSDRVELARKANPRSSSRCTVLFVGRLEPVKGLHPLLEAHRIGRGRRDDLDLVIVGDGSMRAMIEARAKTQSGLRYLGWLGGEELIGAYAAADVFVCPSLSEPWGLVVNEAMAASLPVIVTDMVGCTDDLVQDGTNGFVVPAGDAASLAEKMLLLAADPELRARMARASRTIIGGWTMKDQARIIESAWAGLGDVALSIRSA